MGVLGKDLFDFRRPITHTKVQFGEDGYWVEDEPEIIPYGTTLLAALKLDARKYCELVERLEDRIAARDREGTLEAFYPMLDEFVRLPLYNLFIKEVGLMEVELFHRAFAGEARTALADDIINDNGAILNKYRWARDDLLLIQRRYAWFLDEMAKSRSKEKKLQKKFSLPEQVYWGNVDAFVSGVSLGEDSEVDAPQINVQYAIRTFKGEEADGVCVEVVEKMYFDRLRDFIYVELMKGLQKGYAPRRCLNCGKWFLQTPGVSYSYCSNIAPGETVRTCRDVGALASFREKVQENEIWQIHQRAYKKYYARVLKKKMTKPEFEAWARTAEQIRDAALSRYNRAHGEARSQIAEEVRRELNKL